MITTIRKTVKQSTSQTVMFVLLGALIVGIIAPSFMRQGAAKGSWIIKVNGKEISYQRFMREVQMQSGLIAHMRQQYGQLADLFLKSMGMSSDPKTSAFDQLVREELINQYADTLGVRIHGDYIAECLNNPTFAQHYLGIPPYVYDQSGLLRKEILTQHLKNQALSIHEFEHSIERALKRYQLLRMVSCADYVPTFDLKQQFIATKLGKQFSYLKFSLENFLQKAQEQSVTQDELQAFYDAEKDHYLVPEKRDATVWTFEPHLYQVEVSDDEIMSYYETNKVRAYVDQPVKIQVRSITEQQAKDAGTTLKQIREDLLNNPESQWSKSWTVLPAITRDAKSGALEKAAFLLKDEEEISPIIETGDGKVIIQRVNRIPRTYKPLASVKKEIVENLINKKFKKQFVADLGKVIADEPDALKELVAQKKAKKSFAHAVVKGDDRLSQELFSLKKGNYGFYVEGSVGTVVQLTGITPQYLPELESIQETVKRDLYERRAQEALYETLEKVRVQAGTESFESLQAQYGATLEKTKMFTSADTKTIQELEKKGLPSYILFSLEKVGSLITHGTENECFLVRLDALEAFNEAKFNDAIKELKEQMAKQRGNQYQEAFVASLHKNATIETNNSLFIPSEEYSE